MTFPLIYSSSNTDSPFRFIVLQPLIFFPDLIGRYV